MRVLAILVLGAALAGGAPSEAERIFAEVHALHDVRVPAEVSGRVIRRPENESAHVKKGEVVVALDPVFLRAAARRALARRDWTQLELERVRTLLEKGSVGQAELDQAELAAREADAVAEEATARLERSEIRAPFDGRLVRVHPQAGEYLRVGDTAFRIIDDSTLKIVAYVPGWASLMLKPGATLICEHETGQPSRPLLEVTIFSVAPAAEGPARTFRVEARAKDPTGAWRPGMTGRLRPRS